MRVGGPSAVVAEVDVGRPKQTGKARPTATGAARALAAIAIGLSQTTGLPALASPPVRTPARLARDYAETTPNSPTCST